MCIYQYISIYHAVYDLKKRTILGKLLAVDSVLEILLKRKLALRCCHVTTHSENKLLVESFLRHICEWMRDECKRNDTDIINEKYN